MVVMRMRLTNAMVAAFFVSFPDSVCRLETSHSLFMLQTLRKIRLKPEDTLKGVVLKVCLFLEKCLSNIC